MVGGGFLVLALIALTVWAVVESFMADPDSVRLLPKTVWVILILLFLPFGAAAWFILGRPRKGALTGAKPSRTSSWGPQPSAAPRRGAPIAPDDDPEFLLRLRDQIRNKPDDDPRA